MEDEKNNARRDFYDLLSDFEKVFVCL